MSLTTLKKRLPSAKKKADLEVDISNFLDAGDDKADTLLRFREPRTADLFVDAGRSNRLTASYPDFPPTLQQQILMLASCYVPDKSEVGGVNLDDLIADIANDYRDLFLFLFAEFNQAFPFATNLPAAQEEAGNG